MPTRTSWRLAAAWRSARRPAVVAVAAAALGTGGCSALQTPSMTGGKNAAARTLSPEQLREVAATFEAQGRQARADRLFAVADRRAGVPASRPAAPTGVEPRVEPPSPVPLAPTQLAEASPVAAAPDAGAVRPVSAETKPDAPAPVFQAHAEIPAAPAGPAAVEPRADAAEWGPTSSGAEWRPIARPDGPAAEPDGFRVRRVPTLDAAAAPPPGFRPIPRLDPVAPAP
ncbi:hypothetical protein [Alienimonas sp. DA493]|uniref:hypothetical protein n=1 Tax=Alienimonas sp. DA493 TaxID=3373605 RepID=UPI0037545755